MASKYTHDAVATNGTYKDKSGETKKRYLNIGKCFTDEDGRQSIKLDTIPVGTEWSGWISLYPAKPYEDQRQSTPTHAPAPQQPAPQADEQDDIPF